MGNGIGSLCLCSSGDISGRFNNSTALLPKKHDKPLGNSIFYGRPDTCRFSGEVFSDDDVTLMTFRSVSGATASANSSATASTSLDDSLQHSTVLDSSASFASSGSFTSKMMMMMMPLQHAPRGFSVGSSIVDGFISSPFDRVLNGSDEPLKKVQRSSSSHDERRFQKKPPSKLNLKKILSRAFLRSIFINKENVNNVNSARVSCSSTSLSGELSLHGDHNYLDYDGGGGECEGLMGCHEDLHWAQGRAGEDRVHIVICEDHGWVYVGIYDGFNGPDATDYLLNNLFSAVHDELKGLLCSHKSESMTTTTTTTISDMAKLMDTNSLELGENVLLSVKGNRVVNSCSSSCFNKKKLNLDFVSKRVEGVDSKISDEEVRMKWECEGDGEKVDLEKRMQANLSLSEEAKSAGSFSHSHVLQALSEALRKTEDAFLNTADEMITHDNPVLAMMGSCVLVMLMKGEDVYLMNVGDSRAVLANQTGNSFQLTMEHSTEVKEEVYRIKREHPDDPSAVTKGRVKGYLSVTRAFGVGFLKQPKQNNAVLETFKVNYIGDSPYITCSPSLHHHWLSPNDKFLILSSDGLYQYFTNEEAVAKVESFITMFPDRDPAQLLIEEALSRAAKKAGLNFHELLDIPQGERRLYHDDISIVIISFQGKIWRSLV